MKSLSLLLIPIIFLASCTIDWNDEKEANINDLTIKIQTLEKSPTSIKDGESSSFMNKIFGVSFESFYGSGIFSIDSRGGNDTKIQFIQKPADSMYFMLYGDPLEIFYRLTTDQTPEEKIMKLIETTGNNPNNCVIVKTNGAEGLDHLNIDLKDKNIPYSKSEKEELDRAKKDSEESGGPAYDFTKAEIYNNRLRKECGQYAIGAPPATSKTYGSYFISSSGSITMLYHPSGADPSIIKWETLKLFDPQSN